jgi:hypothetical protein
MATKDGSLHDAAGHSKKVSRWEELSASLKWVAQTAVKLNARTEFFFINRPKGAGTSQEVVVGTGNAGEDETGLAQLHKDISEGPIYGTPLCAALRSLVSKLQPQAAALRAADKKLVVVIATDGEASDGTVGDVAEAMQGLKDLAHVVVRLCTSDHKMVDYWNAIDKTFDFGLDVLDDLDSEAEQVHKLNPWVACEKSSAPNHQILRSQTACARRPFCS